MLPTTVPRAPPRARPAAGSPHLHGRRPRALVPAGRARDRVAVGPATRALRRGRATMRAFAAPGSLPGAGFCRRLRLAPPRGLPARANAVSVTTLGGSIRAGAGCLHRAHHPASTKHRAQRANVRTSPPPRCAGRDRRVPDPTADRGRLGPRPICRCGLPTSTGGTRARALRPKPATPGRGVPADTTPSPARR